VTENKYHELAEYLSKRMRMSHVYQPVMIMKLLSNQGKAKADEIALDLVQNDLSQVEYYTERVNQMVGKVLRNNQIVAKEGGEYQLIGFEKLSDDEREKLIELCAIKINEYKKKRGMMIWDHRRKNRSPIDGSIRYQVLNRANNVCELCGIPSDVRALEVDHIVPKNWKGPDELSNYQALCYKCNTNKRDTDDTDFRNRVELFGNRDEHCVFCTVQQEIVFEHPLAYVIQDKFEVTPGHHLIIPKRHFENYFELKSAELLAFNELLLKTKDKLRNDDASIEGFNIGINQGECAGQTIFHVHIHLIPRRRDDVEHPTGGVRNVFPGKGGY
jgi:diadenosine tetraphosphate (Ap4A) HIT family hydrolase/5-methylcytosine-specific restriction endonuclease McrA